MKYKNITEGRFLERPNRFIAKVEIQDKVETVHVKNTGRCRELLQPGATVYLERSASPGRSTAYDLVAVKKGDRMINMDSQAPNKAVEEWLKEGLLFSDVKLVRPETKYGNSRSDFYIETEQDRIFMEVKGVTLEEDGIARFPDAPSERAVKHVEELAAAGKAGYRSMVMFVIQMENVRYFTPNRDTHPQFADALCQAAGEGVEVLAYDCIVTEEGMKINRPVSVVLDPSKEKMEENVKEIFRKGTLKAIPNLLLKWYDSHKRVLPWRERPDPYRVWVSEIMLQQTRVEAVKPYFERFMKALPDIAALAGVGEEELLKLWEGLGYYNRVRNLRKAAVKIMEEYDGKMPKRCEELQKLPGIGSYTAGAVASIAFGQPVPAVDGNVLRVIARIRQDDRCIDDPKVKKSVEEDLKEIMPAARPGDFNQAMMEIGACVCIPNGAPLCGECPLADICKAHDAKTEREYPKKQKKRPRQIENRTVLLVMDETKAAIRKRPERGLLSGMYEFPSLEGFYTAEEAAEYLADNGLKILRIRPLEDARHVFTHKEWHMKGFLVRVDELEPRPSRGAAKDWIYIEPWEAREKYPIPSAFGAYVKYLWDCGPY